MSTSFNQNVDILPDKGQIMLLCNLLFSINNIANIYIINHISQRCDKPVSNELFLHLTVTKHHYGHGGVQMPVIQSPIAYSAFSARAVLAV